MNLSENQPFTLLKRCAVCTALLVLLCTPSFSQTPFNGFTVEEVEIPAGPLATINAELGTSGTARCWRLYVCMDSPFWELQAFEGVDATPFTLNVTTSFWQSAYGGPLSSSINPATYSLWPSVQYDSWFALGGENNTNQVAYVGNYVGTVFESGSGFVDNTNIGTAIFTTSFPPNSQGLPDADNRVLIGQFTTDGIVSGTFNLQFRQLNADGTTYDPDGPGGEVSVTVNIIQASFDGTPGAMDTPCPIVFLPVELMSFTAAPDGQKVKLNWSTAAEINNDYFTIERSRDLENWEVVETMDGAGNSEHTILYNSFDSAPYEGTSYYRLKQTDYNGEYSYSQIEPVEFMSRPLEVYPNPAKDIFYLGGDLENLASVTLRDSRGRVIFSRISNSVSEWSLEDYNLERGMYVLEFGLKNGAVMTEKLMLR